MTTLADRTIAALRANHDKLTTLVGGLTEDQLTGPSGAGEWSVAQLLSHLGSGAEIGLAGYQVALEGGDAPADDFNRSVWARWDASTPQEQAAGFVEHDGRLVALLESLTDEQRATLEITLGFLPMPISVATAAGMRLNEVVLHAWDVEVAFDADATLDAGSTDVMIEQFTENIGFLLGFIGKPDALSAPARVRLGTSNVGLVIGDSVSVTGDVGEATATFHGHPEAALRLVGGRLGADHTPQGVSVEGNVSLDDLRRVFPGY